MEFLMGLKGMMHTQSLGTALGTQGALLCLSVFAVIIVKSLSSKSECTRNCKGNVICQLPSHVAGFHKRAKEIIHGDKSLRNTQGNCNLSWLIRAPGQCVAFLISFFTFLSLFVFKNWKNISWGLFEKSPQGTQPGKGAWKVTPAVPIATTWLKPLHPFLSWWHFSPDALRRRNGNIL